MRLEMEKRQIRVREALADLRAGMKDAELMEKYNLAAKGLQSLFAKLVAAGMITMEEIEQRMPGLMQSATISEDVQNLAEGEAWRLRRTRPGEQTGQLIRAGDAVADVKSGMSDTQLMEKYRLSSRGLQDLLDKLVDKRLIALEEVERRTETMDSTVDLRGTIEKLNLEEASITGPAKARQSWVCRTCGKAQAKPFKHCPECGATPGTGKPKPESKPAPEVKAPRSPHQPRRQQEPAGQQLAPEIVAKLQQIIDDIRAGFTDPELMTRHRLSYEQLENVFKLLLDSQLTTRGELYGRASLYLETVVVDNAQEASAHYLAFPIPISDAMNPECLGRVRNISESFVGLIGIDAQVDEPRTFIIFPEKFVDIKPFTFDAKCLWSKREAEGVYAGFKITYIAKQDLERLHKLIDSLTLGY